jgi:ABC-type thiamine transport system substrate-binding protein
VNALLIIMGLALLFYFMHRVHGQDGAPCIWQRLHGSQVGTSRGCITRVSLRAKSESSKILAN